MIDFTEEQWNESRPDVTVKQSVDFCLECLFADTIHTCDDVLTNDKLHLTYEELIGALIQARDYINNSEKDGA